MNVHVFIRSTPKRAFVEAMVKFYISYLKIQNSKLNLYITARTNLGKDAGADGLTTHDENSIYIFLESRLSIPMLVITLAHEMVHAYQIAKGLLFCQATEKVELVLWRGQLAVDIAYQDRPWEKQAYARQGELVEALGQCF